MEERYKELLKIHHEKFVNTIEVDRLYPFLQGAQVLATDDILEINKHHRGDEKVEKLLEIIQQKPDFPFQNLCFALQSTYPQLLTAMFLGQNHRDPRTDSQSLSLTSDSEEDILSSTSHSENRSQELDPATPQTYTRIIPSDEYDYELTYKKDEGHSKSKTSIDKGKRGINGESRTSDWHHEYDRLKSQCERAMSEVQSLKRSQEETIRRCEQAMRESESNRQRYKATLGNLQQSKEEIEHLHSEIKKLESEKEILQQDLLNYRNLQDEDKQEISDLHKQLRTVISEKGSTDGIARLYEETLKKYEVLKEDHDLQRKEYTEIFTKHNELMAKFGLCKDENLKLLKQNEALTRERDNLNVDRNIYKQQCTSAIRDLAKVTQQRDEMMKDSNHLLSIQKQKFEAVAKERDAARNEYNLVWAERDSVHKEINQLQDKLNEVTQKNQALEMEKKKSEEGMEMLRRELLTAIQQKEEAEKALEDSQKRYGDVKSKNDDLENQRDDFRKDYVMVTQERDIARKERHEAIKDRDRILRETYERERTQKEQAEEIDQVSKETEALKKIIEKLQHDLTDAKTEADKSKKNRDWALGERDKIVQEREGIRSLCESLRHQRDRAVSDKAQALRDYDNIKKEKMEACKELKEIREKYETIMEKEARKNQLNGVGHNHSRDSAIDADLQELETETVQVDIRGLTPDNLGFDIVGGKDDPVLPNDYAVYVNHIVKGSVADGKLRISDVVLKINNMDVTNVDKRTVLQSLKNSSQVSLLVRRRRCVTPRIWQPIQLNLSLGKDMGIFIEQGLYIARIVPGSTIAKEGMLSTGDRIICVNGTSVENFTPAELMKLLQGCSDPVSIEVWRQMSPFNSAGSSPIPANHKETCQDPGAQLSPAFTKNEDLKHNVWDGNDTLENPKTSGKVKTSSSQTDNLNSSPGSNDWTVKGSKSEKDLDNHKSKNSHRLEKALGKIFKPKSKHHDRHDHDEVSKRHTSNRPTSTINDNVLLEFSLGDQNGNHGTGHRKNIQKREFDNENSGTWPKCYKMQPMKQGTVMMPSPQKYPDRPSITNFFMKGPEKIPPTPPERTEASHIAVKQSPHHSPQSSDSTIKQSNSPIHSPPISTKSTSYLHSNNSSLHPNPAPFVFNPDNAIPNNYGVKHLPPKTKKRPPSSHHNHYDTPNIPPREAWELSRARNRTRSSEKDRPHWHSANLSPFNPSSQFHSSNDSSVSGTGLPTGEYQPGQSMFPSDFSAFNSPPPFHERPTGHGYRMPHNSGGSSLVVRPNPHYNSVHGSQTSAPVAVSPSFSPSYNSPQGSFPDIEPRRSPFDYCNSPCPSVISSTSDPYSYIPSRASSEKTVSDTDGSAKNPYTKNNSKRIYIPPVKTGKTGSVEVVAARTSPTSPSYSEEPVTSSESLHNRRRKPLMGETRKINVERNSQTVGFSIGSGPHGGVFVSSVQEDSLAMEAGLVIGDQLLEICGINMRTATEDMAAKFLRQTGNTLSLLVQFNPDEYNNRAADSSGESTGTSPMNSPESDTFRRSRKISSKSSTHIRIPSSDLPSEPSRYITARKSLPSENLGISIVGQANFGIFVKEVLPNSCVFGHEGLRCGDQILEYNNVDFLTITLEKASTELNKPCAFVRMQAQYNPAKYRQLCNQFNSESFYVRAHFDHKPSGEGELSFRKDDIMLIENTLYDGKPDNWFAWLVDDDGHKLNYKGIIPSQDKLEMELRRSYSESLSLHDLEEIRGSTRRMSGSARSSFFRRKAKHKRNNSKDSREFNSFSETSLTSDSVPVLEDLAFNKYTKVERMEYKDTRPVILLAPLADSLIKKLVAESPDKYSTGPPTVMPQTKQVMEQGLADGIYIDYWQEEDKFQCIRTAVIKEICDQGKHCLLNISPSAIERLHRLQIYPIVVFARHRSHKQLREITDPQFHSQKLSAKSAKDLYDKFHKLEKDYQHQFSAIIQGGNLAEMHQQVKTVIANEQKKAIWVPVCPRV
ncbi:disks large homolog 5-like isoform X2 [Saccostrea echinata]|uniref:disks large homolog 5-like isoform X2 n=1 Tax=Saccostrea echinata TaxID=191078 RepID=UPI002A818A92|nr:disks large homolog 5-like isoform X2 [Saccostrea echinata]